MRKHIDSLDTLYAITGIQDGRQFGSQRIRIT
jgi:hypothetical protein